MISDNFAENLVDTALNNGAEKAEIFLAEKTETEITINNQKPESVNVKTDEGYGMRVLVDSKIGFYSSNRIEPLCAVENIRNLVKATRLHTPDPFNVLPVWEGEQTSEIVEIYDEALAETPLSQKIETAIQIEKAGLAYDPRVAGFVWILYGDVTETYRVLSSSGIDVTSSGTSCYGFAYCYARNDGNAQTGRFAKAYGYYNDMKPEEIGEKAAEYAVRMLDARDIKSRSLDAIFPPEAGIPLLYSLFGMIEADSVQKGKSPFRRKLNHKVAADTVTIIDDGTMPKGLASRPYDSEGIPTGKTSVIEKGVLKSYLYDSYTAKKGNTRSTGNAGRMGYSNKPAIHPTNFYMLPGKCNPLELVARTESGVIVTELSGLHAGINHATADFSVPAKGLLVEHGQVVHAVDNISLAGNLFNLLESISDVCFDLSWEPIDGMIGSPTFKVNNIRIVGRG